VVDTIRAVRIDSWDSAFVRARRRDVHPVLADVGGYVEWWPRLRARAGHERWLLEHRRPGGLRQVRVWLQVTKVRTDLGVDFALTGELVGDAEWYYLDEPTGVVVHHLLRVHAPDRGGQRLVEAYRGSVRAALHELKRRLEGPRVAGDEPDSQLVRDQADAAAEFRRQVEAHKAKVAAGLDQVDRGDGSGRR
jgi:hypothetical protein